MKLSATGLGMIAVSILSVLLLGPQAVADARALGVADFGDALGRLASLLLVIIGTWLLMCVVFSMLARHATFALRLSRAITPRFVSRALFLGAAGALAVGPVVASPSGQGAGHDKTSISRLFDGLRLPDRPVGGNHGASPTERAVASRTYTVRPGDSLWAIAARDLDPTTSPTVVAAVMRRWYAANRAVIGPDPNLILPGQRLVRPTGELVRGEVS